MNLAVSLSRLDPTAAIRDLWLLWALSWLLAAPFAARAAKRSRWMMVPLTVVGLIAIVAWNQAGQLLTRPLWPVAELFGWLYVGVVLVGFGFAWWARLTLGRLWSGFITLKEGHHIVDQGPYALVRHPIYSGILLAMVATALASPSRLALVMAAAILMVLVTKAWAEERFLGQELGEEAYAAYRARVPMLVPFLPK
jgi:protein-S-isoprenylcysteine O-methyltransferase Ste14